MSCDENGLICYLFFNVINRFKSSSSSPQINDRFDLYVKEVFKCLLGNDIYKESMMNLKYLNDDSFYQTVYKDFSNTNELYKSLNKITRDIDSNNRNYSIYSRSFNLYISEMILIIANLKEKIKYHFEEELVEIGSKSFVILPDQSPQFKDKLKNFQLTIRYTNFYSKFDEFLHFYSKSRTFFPEEPNKLPQIGKDDMNFLLKFLYYSFVNNQENFILLSNINSKYFLYTFKDVESFYVVLSVMADFFYPRKDSYKLNNSNFILEILNFLINDINIHNKVSYFFIKDLPRYTFIIQKCVKIITKSVRHISIHDIRILKIIESLSIKINELISTYQIETFSMNLIFPLKSESLPQLQSKL